MPSASTDFQAFMPGAPTFGAELYSFRVRSSMSQRQLAIAASLSPSTVSELENCRRNPPCPAVVNRLAAVLRLNDEELHQFKKLAERGRAALGLRVNRKMPRAVSELIRDIALVSEQLTQSQIQEIRRNLETPMT